MTVARRSECEGCGVKTENVAVKTGLSYPAVEKTYVEPLAAYRK
jgi:hypothetical protein